ncbi:hypothetical protein UF75_3391 [Desulfosporosinus sp. I2]|nr:hypothetical protein UF75_3391 [Desulfosporosinus sp. I2]
MRIGTRDVIIQLSETSNVRVEEKKPASVESVSSTSDLKNA